MCGNCDVAGAATKGGAPDEAAVWSSDLPRAQCLWEGKLVCIVEEVNPAQGTDHIGETHSHLWVLCALVSWQNFWVECIPFNIKFPLFLLAAQLQRLIHILKVRPHPGWASGQWE